MKVVYADYVYLVTYMESIMVIERISSFFQKILAKHLEVSGRKRVCVRWCINFRVCSPCLYWQINQHCVFALGE